MIPFVHLEEFALGLLIRGCISGMSWKHQLYNTAAAHLVGISVRISIALVQFFPEAPGFTLASINRPFKDNLTRQ